jgi:hypothetical protein
MYHDSNAARFTSYWHTPTTLWQPKTQATINIDDSEFFQTKCCGNWVCFHHQVYEKKQPLLSLSVTDSYSPSLCAVSQLNRNISFLTSGDRNGKRNPSAAQKFHIKCESGFSGNGIPVKLQYLNIYIKANQVFQFKSNYTEIEIHVSVSLSVIVYIIDTRKAYLVNKL